MKPLKAGDLRYRVVIQRKQSGRDPTGAPLPATWRDVGRAWGDIRFISSSSVIATAQDKTVSVYLLTLRKRSDVSIGDRVLSGGTAYHVLSIDNSMPDRMLLRTQTDVIDDQYSD
ncbi:phage head closure protein [Plesiomonas shigelloides]|uniref:phage head closure protein n=1 Tax=Plesiomonas shigelloides TaxID=703 RepID=UPI001261FA7A|nr:phage head closure protein [Plesiomonas shigelloides]KAB7707806.1 phage head closure protein [Plesiomonas shigelloides]